MVADETTVVQSNYEYSVTLDNSSVPPPATLAQSLSQESVQTDPSIYKPVDPSKIPVGEVNN